ncbi:MAG: ABC transporter permease [Armatimonadetes bacterium]|jgi:ribose/xylose/arabinose/galactoside ABC-type transport system permease subunit|nr:ABC transporter permease [Armatimonadota bacterium]
MRLLYTVKESPVIVLCVGLFVCFALWVPNFVDGFGILDDVKQYASYAILAVGLTLIIGSAGIDISVGSVLGFSTVLFGCAMARGAGLLQASLLALFAGTVWGAINGFFVAKIKLQPIVVTLSSMAAARGLAYVIAGQGISSIPLPASASGLVNMTYGSYAPLLLALIVAVGGWLLLAKTPLGRYILAVGSNEEAARFSGIDVAATKYSIYVITGFLAGLAGIVTAGMMNTAITDAGLGYEFEAITAVLIGGTSISGGEATVLGSILGVVAVSLLNRGLGLLGINDLELWRMLCLGVILIVSVLLDQLRKRAARISARAQAA